MKSMKLDSVKLSLWVAFFISFAGDFLFGLAGLAVPMVAAEIGATDFQIGLIISSYGAIYCFFPMIAGRISDRIGRKASMLISFSVYLFVSLSFAYGRKIWILMAAGVLQGISLAFLWPAISSLIVELSTKENKGKNIDIYMSAWNLGAIVGPFLGGILYHFFGARNTFLFLTGFSLFCLMLIQIFIKSVNLNQNFIETPNSTQEKDASSLDSTKYSSNQILLFYIFGYAMILLSAIYLLILTSYYSGYASKYTSLNPSLIGIIVFFMPLGRGVSFAIMRNISLQRKLQLTPLLVFFAFLIFFLINGAQNLAILICCFIFLGIVAGFGFSGGFSIITGFSNEKRGLLTGIAESMVGIAFFFTPIVPFLLIGNHPESPFIFARWSLLGLFCLFISLQAIILSLNRKQAKKSQ
jgi:MFS family permease